MKETRVKRCQKCTNHCKLTEPKCSTGMKLAAEGDLYETVEKEKTEPRFIAELKYRFGRNRYRF